MLRLLKIPKRLSRSVFQSSFLSSRQKQVTSAYRKSERRLMATIYCGPCRPWASTSTWNHSRSTFENTERLLVVRNQIKPHMLGCKNETRDHSWLYGTRRVCSCGQCKIFMNLFCKVSYWDALCVNFFLLLLRRLVNSLVAVSQPYCNV